MAEISSTGRESITSLDGKVSIPVSGTGSDTKITVAIDGEDRFKLDSTEFKVSQPGVDVNASTDKQSIVNSSDNVFKIIISGTASLTYDGNVNTFVTIPHGQSDIPIVLAYVKLPNNANFNPMAGNYVPMPFYQLRTGLPSVQCTQTVDATNIYLRVHDIYAPPNQDYSFRYYVLQESAS